MAGAEPAAEITSLADRHTTQMRADAQHDKPFGLLNAVRIGLRVTETFPLSVFSFLNLVGSAVADEDGLSTPFDNNLRALVTRTKLERRPEWRLRHA